jgi:zinc-ribbon family
MIIWGFRVIMRVLSSGAFFCPKEDGDRPYQLKSQQRFFTIFFIPLIPLKKFDNLVECQSCRTLYKESVLQRPTATAQSSNMAEVVRVATVSMLRTSPQTDVALAAKANEQGLRHINEYYPTYDASALATDVAQLDVTALPSMLTNIAAFSDPQHKEGVLTRLTLTALGGKGSLTESERSLLNNVGMTLGLTPPHARGVIDSVVEQATPK